MKMTIETYLTCPQLRARLRADEEFDVDEYELAALFGLRLPFVSGGELLTEGETSRLLGISGRQIRNLVRRGLPRRLVKSHSRYPALDALHWYMGHSQRVGHAELFHQPAVRNTTLATARDCVMRFNYRDDPDHYVRIPLRLARLSGLPIAGTEWPEIVTVSAPIEDLILSRAEHALTGTP